MLMLIKLINSCFCGLENPHIGGLFVRGIENDFNAVRPGLMLQR